MISDLKVYDLVRCIRATPEAVSGLELNKYYVVSSVSTFADNTRISVTTLDGTAAKWAEEEKNFTLYSVGLRFEKVHLPEEDRIVVMAAMSLARR